MVKDWAGQIKISNLIFLVDCFQPWPKLVPLMYAIHQGVIANTVLR